ncbi:hypothetical protein Efla_004525 [Eimeria flavescens]
MEQNEQQQQQQQQTAAGSKDFFETSKDSSAAVCCTAASSSSSSGRHQQRGLLPSTAVHLRRGRLLIWEDAATGSGHLVTASELRDSESAVETQAPHATDRGPPSPLSEASPALTVVQMGAPMRQYPPLLQHQQLEGQKQSLSCLSGATLMRQLLLGEEAETAYFSPSWLPLLLHIFCQCGSKPSMAVFGKQQRQLLCSLTRKKSAEGAAIGSHARGPTGAQAAAEERHPALTDEAAAAAAARAATDSSRFVSQLLWAAASWRSRLTAQLPPAAAAAELGLDSKAAAVAEGFLAADAEAPAAIAAAVAGGEAQLRWRLHEESAAAAASLPLSICPHLAAMRALAYWCCCCALAEQQHILQQQPQQQQQQQQQHGLTQSDTDSTAARSSSTNSSTALLRQLQDTCRESFLLLLKRQQDAQQQLAERQGLEMEAACALREKQEQLLQAAAAPRCSSADGSDDLRNTAAAALEASEKELEELVLQHVSECELLERHWKHEQQLLRQQQLRLFKDVAADLYLLQHCPAAAAGGFESRQLVLPPLPSADETDKLAFDWQQQQQQQPQPFVQQQQQQLGRKQVGAAARHLFGKRDGELNREASFEEVAAAAAGVAPAADRLHVSGSFKKPASLTDPLSAASQRQQQQQQRVSGGSTRATISGAAFFRLPSEAAASLEGRRQQQEQQQQQKLQKSSSADLSVATLAQRQLRRQQLRQAATAVATPPAAAAAAVDSGQGPVFDMLNLLKGVAADTRATQRQQPLLRQIGGMQEHAQIRLMFGSQQRRSVWLHVCTGLLSDFFSPAPTPAAGAAAAEQQQQHQQRHGGASLASAGQWLSLLARGDAQWSADFPERGRRAPSSYCYKDIRDLRGSPNLAFAAAAAAAASSSRRQVEEAAAGRQAADGALPAASSPSHEAPFADLFAALRGAPQASLAGALLPTGAALQESCMRVRAASEVPDLLLPSVEEQRRLLHATIQTASQREAKTSSGSSSSSSDSSSNSNRHRLLLHPGELFVSRHASGPAAQVCFHLVVAAHVDRSVEKAAEGGGPLQAANSQKAELVYGESSRSGSLGDSAILSAAVCAGLRQVLRLCERHAVGALLLPLLLLETEAPSSCLPFAYLQRRVLAVLRCLVAELRATALSPAGGSLCPDAAASRLKHLVLLLPPMQTQQQPHPDGGIRTNPVQSDRYANRAASAACRPLVTEVVAREGESRKLSGKTSPGK